MSPPGEAGGHAGKLEAAVEVAVELGAVDDAFAETAVEFGVRGLGGGGGPEVGEGALKGEPVHVVEGDAAGFDRFAVVDGGKADGAVDDDDAQRVVEEGGEGLVVDVEDALAQAELFGEAGDELGVVVVTTVEGVVLEDEGGLGVGVRGKGAEDLGDEAVHGLVVGVDQKLGVGGDLQGDEEIPA